MQIAVGYEFIWELPKPTPMLLTVHIHYSRASDLAVVDNLVTVPSVPVTGYRDLFGNWISRIVAPVGQFLLSSRAIVNDSGRPDPVCLDAIQHAVCCSWSAADIAKRTVCRRCLELGRGKSAWVGPRAGCLRLRS